MNCKCNDIMEMSNNYLDNIGTDTDEVELYLDCPSCGYRRKLEVSLSDCEEDTD